MRVALLIVTYNRPEYLRETLSGIAYADLSRVDNILIVDNNSTDPKTLTLLKECGYDVTYQPSPNGISYNLLTGYEQLFQTHDIVINLDSDALVCPDCFTKLLELYKPNTLLTGFHSTTENRHKILSEHDGYCIKHSVGGINFCIDKEAYYNFVKPALIETNPHGNFDHQSCLRAGGVMCAVPSLVQHIGINSSLGHNDNPDIADDFYYWDLPEVTLFGVDVQPDRLNKAKDICTKWIKFANVVTLNPDLHSKEAYSQFIIKECYKHISTTHVLVFQHDGFVNNFKAWNNDWLQYDYIGAPWWYNDGMDVGNGGFSLRSKRLMEIVATDLNITDLHPEDDKICRKYRAYLEQQYGIKFAPVEVAEKFAFEGYRQPSKFLSDQFGVHGPSPRTSPERKRSERFVINQFAGLGDILFMVPMVRALMHEGNEVIWPVADHYFNIAKHFPDINMMPKSTIDVPYQSMLAVNTPYGKLLPYRFAMELMHRTLVQCMQSKYELYGHSWSMWRELTFLRDKEAEARLMKLMNLDCNKPQKYQLVNRYYGAPEGNRTITPELNPDLTVVEMGTIEGFSLIDWCGIIEGASEIHTANTSLLYILEILDLKMPIHFYKRHLWGEQGYEHTQALYTKPYILH